jgi:hypothetical protein
MIKETQLHPYVFILKLMWVYMQTDTLIFNEGDLFGQASDLFELSLRILGVSYQ